MSRQPRDAREDIRAIEEEKKKMQFNNLAETLVEIAQTDTSLKAISPKLTEAIAVALTALAPVEKKDWPAVKWKIFKKYEEAAIALAGVFIDKFLLTRPLEETPATLRTEFYNIFTNALTKASTYLLEHMKEEDLSNILNLLEASINYARKVVTDGLKFHIKELVNNKQKIYDLYGVLYKTYRMSNNQPAHRWLIYRERRSKLANKIPRTKEEITVTASEIEAKMRALSAAFTDVIKKIEETAELQQLQPSDMLQNSRIRMLNSLEKIYQDLLDFEKTLEDRKAALKKNVQQFQPDKDWKKDEVTLIMATILALRKEYSLPRHDSKNLAGFFQQGPALLPIEPPVAPLFTGKLGEPRPPEFDLKHCVYFKLTKEHCRTQDSLKAWLTFYGTIDKFRAPDDNKRFQILLGQIFKTQKSLVTDLLSLIKYKEIFMDAFKKHLNPDTPEVNKSLLEIFERYVNVVAENTIDPRIIEAEKLANLLKEPEETAAEANEETPKDDKSSTFEL